MNSLRCILAFVLLLFSSNVALLSQECHDYDADNSEAGYDCATATDCEDNAWFQNPSAIDTCNGIDDDCNNDLDQGCDRYCEDPVVFWQKPPIVNESYPELLSGCATRTDYGYLVVTSTLVGDPGDEDVRLLYSRPYDHRGLPLATSIAIGDLSNPQPEEIRCEIAYNGDRALVAWQDASAGSQQNTFKLKARLVGRFGAPVNGTVLNLSDTSPFPVKAPWNDIALVWNGEEYAVFWEVASADRNSLLMSTVDRSGQLLQAESIIVTNSVDGQASPLNQVDAIWTGSSYVCIVRLDPAGGGNNLHSLKISSGGLVLNHSAIPAHAGNIRIASGLAKNLVAWTDDDYLQLRQKAAFVDSDGNYQPGTGLLTLGSFPNNGFSIPVEISWSGEMYGVMSGIGDWTGNGYAYHWKFYRVLENGSVLDNGGEDFDVNQNYPWEVIWNGQEFLTLGGIGRLEHAFHRMICSCDDLDGDNYDACTQFDCDDTDPLVHPTLPEDCRGLKDENCNGLVDCDDPQCPGGVGPGEITDFGWDSSGNLTWSNPGGAERYDLARGVLSDLKRREDLMNAECAGLELDTNSWVDDGRDPPLGEVLWYVVRPEGTPCSYGTWGPGANPREITICR